MCFFPQSCNISGPLPMAWSSLGPFATGVYIHMYPVYIDLSRNQLSGVLSPSWLQPLMSCYISRLDLGYNKLAVDLGSSVTGNGMSCDSSGGMAAPCSFFSSVDMSTASFIRHVGIGQV